MLSFPAAVEPEWFSTWFDSPYYHLLYHDRDQAEAQAFLAALLQHLQPRPGARLLDLACGRGRHAIYLHAQGYDVTGLDLSAQSIAAARQHAHPRLQFHRHDMREPLPYGSFDLVLNLFTSFGYFEHEDDNVTALRHAAAALRPGGRLVIDFLNPARTVRELVARERKTVDGIAFELHRRLDAGFIVKDIYFEDRHGRPRHYQERVRALSRARFADYFRLAGLQLAEVLGDYQLGPFEEARSPRMIFILTK